MNGGIETPIYVNYVQLRLGRVYYRIQSKLVHAMDDVGKNLNDRFQKWYFALANVPICGEQVDSQLQEYIEGCRLVPLGNLIWR